MTFNFVPAADSDRPYLMKLRKLTMVEYLEGAGQFLSEKEHLERVDYQFHNSYMVFAEAELIGTIKYRSESNSIEIIQIQIHPSHQSKGYGSGIIQQIIAGAKGKKVHLSVLKNNPAKSLYERLGFELVGEDSKEYHMELECP